MFRRIFKYAVLIAVLLLIGIQWIQPDRKNPPVDAAATFEAVVKPAPQVAAIVQRACYDCHSDSTSWPWYSRIAPVSWLIAGDVREGRARLNFSQWNLLGADMSKRRLKEACREMRKGSMPLWNYKLAHPRARLTTLDLDTFCSGTDPDSTGTVRN